LILPLNSHQPTEQNQKIKSPIININHQFNQAFDNMNKELSPSFYLVDTFSNFSLLTL